MADDPHPPTSAIAAASAYDLAADLAAGRTTSVELTQALLDRIAVVDGPGAGPPARRARAGPRRPRAGGPARRRAGRRAGPRAAPRGPDPGEGQHRGRRAARHGRIARPGRAHGGPRRPDRRRPPRGRPRGPRRHEPLGVGQPALAAVGQRLVGRRRPHRQPVGARPQRRRVVVGIGRRAGRGAGAARPRHRDRRLHHLPVLAQRRGRTQAHGGPALHRRRRPAEQQPGLRRARWPVRSATPRSSSMR